LDSMLIETDSPYLAPMPHRGKMNQPAYVKYVALMLAGLKNTAFETIAEKTKNNYERLFKVY
jgi:TatD DNase family protein